MTKASEKTGLVSAALVKMQGLLKDPPKNKTNPHFKSKYADLISGLDCIRPALQAAELAVLQATKIDGDMLVLETRLQHSSGEWLSGEYPVCRVATEPQKMGAALTYARRFALFSLVGVSGDDDDDGNVAQSAYSGNKKAQSIVNNDDLLRDAKARAGAGTQAYQQFWQELSADEKRVLSAHHETLKKSAAAADSERAQAH